MTFFELTLVILVKIVVVFAITITSIPVLVLVERKVLGWMQMRPGPNRVGPWGLLQTLVDGVKLLFKENVIPKGVEPLTYQLAPILVIAPALIVACVVPFGPVIEIAGKSIPLSITDLDMGLLFVFAIASLTAYGIVLAGWSSDNKWSLLGGMRSVAQMISYEASLGLAVVGVLLLCGTFSLREIVDQQGLGVIDAENPKHVGLWFWHWNVFRQPLGFFLFLIAGMAEVNRVPFDFPEGESELTGGYHTEYSSMRFAMFFMGEYMNLFLMSAIITTLFLGGFYPPYPCAFGGSWLGGVHGFAWFMAKTGAFCLFFIWIRGTLPRLRYDQLMVLGWKILLPLAFFNIAATAVFIAVVTAIAGNEAVERFGWILGLVGLAAIVFTDLLLSRLFWSRRRAAG